MCKCLSASFQFFVYIPKEQLLNHVEILSLNFWVITILFVIVGVAVYVPTGKGAHFQFLQIHNISCCFQPFEKCNIHVCHCVFVLHLLISDVVFLKIYWPFICHFWRNQLLSFTSFVCSSYCCLVLGIRCILKMLFTFQLFHLQLFSFILVGSYFFLLCWSYPFIHILVFFLKICIQHSIV